MKLLTKESSLISEEQIIEDAKKLSDYREHLVAVAEKNTYDDAESSINLPFDEALLAEVTEFANKLVTTKLRYVIDIGIGGSNLGTKAIYDGLQGFYDAFIPDHFPKMLFSDTTDPEVLTKLTQFLQTTIADPEEVLLCVISKSGGTTETIANFETIAAALQAKFPNIAHRCVAITDKGSKFWNAAGEKQIARLPLPQQVGGRYSVLSAVGLFPLLACGIDIVQLRNGAQAMRERCLSAELMDNPALISASVLFQGLQIGRVINDTFIFHESLESLGKWYRQLMGESVGKEQDLTGKIVNTGITPTVSIGSTDLHSVGQLYLGGPKDKTTTFVYAQPTTSELKTPETFIFPDLVPNIADRPMSDLMQAILEGVKIAYTKRGVSFMEVVLDDLSAYSLGEFLQFKMIEMMYLGKLMNVNTFDQPNVESYKIETKQILAK